MNLKNLCKELNINDRVWFKGKLSGDELYAWYNLAQIFVLPSSFEPFGAVVNEALVAGCYSIVSKHVGASCIIEKGINGEIFYDNYDLEDLLEKSLANVSVLSANIFKPNILKAGIHSYFNDLVYFLNKEDSGTTALNEVKQPEAIIFYTYLPPWRIDVFNKIAEYYNLTIYFLNPNLEALS